jgi:diguanylate cyclase (GGDEF)-like protein/PAS domain S-box-containing protein
MTSTPDRGAPRDPDDLPLAARIEDHPMCLAPEIAQRLSPTEQAAFFCTLVDSALDAIIAHRSDGRVVWANQGASELLGYTSDELLDLSPYEWVAPAYIPTAPARIENILRSGKMTFESAVRCRDGATIETEVSAKRVDTAFGPLVVAVIRDIEQWSESKSALVRLAYHDPLTDLANRAHLDERLAIAVADARRFGDVLGLAYVDLDRFKLINEQFGHDVGDEVIIEIGRRLRSEVRVQDMVARIGGDEFAITLSRLASGEALARVATRLATSITQPVTALGHTLNISASMGLASFDPDKDDPRSLLVKANVAMCVAKRNPECTWLLHADGMTIPEARIED